MGDDRDSLQPILKMDVRCVTSKIEEIYARDVRGQGESGLRL